MSRRKREGAKEKAKEEAREDAGKAPVLGPIGWTDVEWPPGNAIEVHHALLEAGDREGAAKWLAAVSVDVLAQLEEGMARK